jgi:signal transduction histidine kinase
VTIRVLVVDDQEVIRTAVAELLGDDPSLDVVGQATDGAEAVEQAAALAPGVVVMDMRMPVMDGVEATRRIALAQPEVHVLVHSAYGDESLVIEAFQAGARGYVLKGSSASDLLKAVQNVAGGHAHVSDEVARPLITKLIQALDRERQTRVAAEEAADLVARVSAQQQEFAIQAAHELRTPLTTLLGALELLADLEDVPSGQRRSLAASALEAARRFARLTTDLEVVATGDSLAFAIAKVDVADTVRAVLAEFPAQDLHVEVGDVSVLADRERLHQVLGHVVRNALSVSPAPGSIRVRTARDDEMVVIDVSDRGPGFDPNVLEAMFEPFVHTLGSACGLGVGLAVVRELTRGMGGSVTASNNNDGGATVRIALRGTAR